MQLFTDLLTAGEPDDFAFASQGDSRRAGSDVRFMLVSRRVLIIFELRKARH